MDARLVMHVSCPALPRMSQLNTHRRRFSPRIVSVMTTPTDNIERLTTSRTEYKDNWFDSIAINHLSQSVQEAIGFKSNKKGYEGLLEATTLARQHFSPERQRELVIRALDKAFPKPILSLIRAILPPSKIQREYFAVFTTIFFPWLVGPCEVRESEFNGRAEKNVVHIRKCRFLEQSNCVNMCTNLCKMSSQAFIKDSFGVPVNMVPNFDDMSCEMIFGQEPLAPTEDPAFKQPCYKLFDTLRTCRELKLDHITVTEDIGPPVAQLKVMQSKSTVHPALTNPETQRPDILKFLENCTSNYLF